MHALQMQAIILAVTEYLAHHLEDIQVKDLILVHTDGIRYREQCFLMQRDEPH